MRRRDYNDGKADQNFERDRIDGRVLEIVWMKRALINFTVQPAQHANLGRAQCL